MAFIVPNAGQTGGSATYINVNQAEPDSLDFEILGNRSSWIRSGGGVTVSSSQVTVSGGTAVIQGVPYTFNNATVSIPNCATSGVARFDALVVRLSSDVATVTRIGGIESGTNPTLPQSRSTLGTASFLSGSHVDFSTDVVLYVVYKDGVTNLTGANVVDKRVIDTRPVTYASTVVPTNGTAGVIGDRRIVAGSAWTYVTDSPGSGETNWIADGSEKGMGDYSPPIGTIIGWAGSVQPANSSLLLTQSRFLPCDGRSLSKTSYESLWNVIGYKFGGTGASFNLPQLNDERTIYGVGITTTTFGTSGGVNEIKLTENYIPSHNHSLNTNNTDNSHNPHKHDVNVVNNSTPGGSQYLMAGNADVGTKTTRKTEENDVGLGHSPNMGSYGKSGSDQVAVPLKGQHLNLSWYIRVK